MGIESLRRANAKNNGSHAPFTAARDACSRAIFKSAEALSHRLDHADTAQLRFEPAFTPSQKPTPSTWLFVASYGEVVLIQGYIAALKRAELIPEVLLIVCNQIELAASIRRVFPSAIVVASDGRRAM